MHFLQTFTLDMSVDLCRRNIGMSEHGLNRPKIGSSSQKMRGKGMPQHVRKYRFRQSSALRP